MLYLAVSYVAIGVIGSAAMAQSRSPLQLTALKQPVNQQIYSRVIAVLGLLGCLLMSLSLLLPVIGSGLVLLLLGFGIRLLVRQLGNGRR